MQIVPAADYRLRRIRLTAAVRVEGERTRAQMWLRLDTQSGMAFLDNMGNRPITSPEWQTYSIETDVGPDIHRIGYGVMLFGPGKAWVDDVKLETVELVPDRVEPARPLSEAGLRNLTAFSKLYGYVRFFHPSDQVDKADWDAIAIDGVRGVEDAATVEELSGRLLKLFAPVAPTLKLSQKGASAVDLARGPERVRFVHHGVQLPGSAAPYPLPYRTGRERSAANDGAAPIVWEAELIPGLRASVPLEVYAKAGKTLPAIEMPQWKQMHRSALDRATRLAGVIITWNVMQHFYPYFDVVKADWSAEQTKALQAAAIDTTPAQFHTTLRRMIAALKDGHGSVQPPGGSQMFGVAPVTLDFIEDRLTVVRVQKDAPPEVAVGDRVLKIDGKQVEAAIAETRPLISAATKQSMDHKTAVELIRCNPETLKTRLELESMTGTVKHVTLACAPPQGRMSALKEARPEEIFKQVEPGIYYVDMTRISDEEWYRHVGELAAAKGIVFDLRGYPGRAGLNMLAHVTDKPIRCARWNIPTPSKPDQIDITFSESGWDVQPAAPYFKGSRVFLTDGRAISYAETVMGIVENYKLGEIVGSPTAGTNGNVNPFKLPGGYTVMWTGMKVLKHDKSQHHGIGILPTVPVARTRKGVAEGKDEVLLRGLEVAKAKAQ